MSCCYVDTVLCHGENTLILCLESYEETILALNEKIKSLRTEFEQNYQKLKEQVLDEVVSKIDETMRKFYSTLSCLFFSLGYTVVWDMQVRAGFKNCLLL